MALIPTKQLISLQQKLKKNPERYYRTAFVESTLATTLLEGEEITRGEVEELSAPFIQSLSQHGYFKRFKS